MSSQPIKEFSVILLVFPIIVGNSTLEFPRQPLILRIDSFQCGHMGCIVVVTQDPISSVLNHLSLRDGIPIAEILDLPFFCQPVEILSVIILVLPIILRDTMLEFPRNPFVLTV